MLAKLCDKVASFNFENDMCNWVLFICVTSDLAYSDINMMMTFFCDRPEFQSKQKIKLVTPSFDYIYTDLPLFYLLCIQNTNHLIATLCKMTSSINHFCISPF